MATGFDPYHRWLGIPPEEQPPDYYRLLGITRFESDAEVISNASDQRMTHLRTFATGKNSAESQRLLSEIATATRHLLDAAKKTQYDEQLRAKMAQETKPQPSKSLKVAQALPLPTTPIPAPQPLPAPARPLQPVPAPAASPISLADQGPAPSGGGRRAPRPASNTGIIIAVVAVVAVVLIGGGSFVAYRMSRPQVVENDPKPEPRPKPKPKPAPKPIEKPVEKPTDRLAWFYGVAPDGKSWGVIEQTEGGQWRQSETSGQSYSFTELSRTDDYIELQENRVKVINRLYKDRLETHRVNKWVTAQKGRWVPPAEVAGLMKSGESGRVANNTPKSPPRLAWHYTDSPEGARGIVYRVVGKNWEERSSDGRVNKFIEQESSDPAVVVLFDDARNLRVWLKETEMTYSKNGSRETFCMNGGWVEPKEQQTILASFPASKPNTPASTQKRTIWFYADYNGQKGHFRARSNNTWDEFVEASLKWSFNETERTDEYIELQNKNSGFKIRLYDDHAEETFNQPEFKAAQKGEWISTAQLATRMSAKKPAFDYATAAVFYIPATDGGDGSYFLRTGQGWQEYVGTQLKQQWREAGHSNTMVLLEANNQRISLFGDHVTGSGPRRSGSWITRDELDARLSGKPSSEPTGKSTPSYVFAGLGKAELKSSRLLVETGKPFTLECWYRRSGETKSMAGLFQLGDLNLVIGEGNEKGQPCSDYQLFGAGSGLSLTAKYGTLPNEEWHHLVLMGDAGKIHVFHDGKPYHQATFTQLGVGSLTPIVLGSARSNEGPESFTGEMKALRLFDQAKYRPGQAFDPGTPGAGELPADVTLVLNNVKVEKPGGSTSPPPRSLGDLVGKPTPETKPVERVKPPEADSLKAAQAKVAEVYGDKVKGAIKPEDKQKLAAELLKIAGSDQDAGQAYALLIEGRKLAVAAGDVELGIEIVNQVDERFDVDRLAMLEKLFNETEKRNLLPPQRERLVAEALAGTYEALRLEKVPQADTLSVIATRNASKGKDPERKKAALALREQVAAIKNSYDAMQTAQEKLKNDPEDPSANLAMGRYIAFIGGNFPKGSEHLMKGSDAALAVAAKKQLAVESDDDRLAAAEAWHGLLASLKSPAEKLQIQRHVLKECEDLSKKLTGLAKAQADKHVSQLRPIVAEADKFDAAPNRASTKRVPGLVMRIFAYNGAGQAPTPYVGIVSSDTDLFRLGGLNLVRAYGGGSSPRYALSGMIVVENDMEVDMRFYDCAVTIAGQTSAASASRLVPMKKGVYPITILSTDSSPGFAVTRPDTRESLFFHSERDLENELAKTAPDVNGAPTKSQKIN